jgi:hypothetical protein
MTTAIVLLKVFFPYSVRIGFLVFGRGAVRVLRMIGSGRRRSMTDESYIRTCTGMHMRV